MSTYTLGKELLLQHPATCPHLGQSLCLRGKTLPKIKAFDLCHTKKEVCEPKRASQSRGQQFMEAVSTKESLR